MRWQGRKQSSNVEDRRGQGSRIGGKSTGIIGIIILLVGAYYGVDLSGVVGSPAAGTQVAQPSTLNSQQEAQLNELARVVLADTETTWSQYFANNNARYTPPTMVLYTAGTQTACGTGQAAMGPFYCPQDRKVYLDLSFYEDMRKQLGASGDAAFAYVIAHEVGHHVQNLLGITDKVDAMRGRISETQMNALSVRLELQADCLAGVWGHHAHKSRQILENGDIERAMDAAAKIGDDAIQKRSQGHVVPDSFTHGSSAQRVRWFTTGIQTGSVQACDTFNASSL